LLFPLSIIPSTPSFNVSLLTQPV
jgi:hypothetical protein